jgi:hypothetical protein
MGRGPGQPAVRKGTVEQRQAIQGAAQPGQVQRRAFGNSQTLARVVTQTRVPEPNETSPHSQPPQPQRQRAVHGTRYPAQPPQRTIQHQPGLEAQDAWPVVAKGAIEVPVRNRDRQIECHEKVL